MALGFVSECPRARRKGSSCKGARLAKLVNTAGFVATFAGAGSGAGASGIGVDNVSEVMVMLPALDSLCVRRCHPARSSSYPIHPR